jgi:hypothetical protein
MRIPRPTLAAGALLSLVLGAGSPCSAASITYDINQTIGAGGVTGSIVTDGKIGTLVQSDIVDWNLLLNDGTNTRRLLGPLSGSNSVVFLEYFTTPNLSATETQLLFNFSASNANGPNSLIFETTVSPTDGYLCFNTERCTIDLPNPPPGFGVETLSATPNLQNFQDTNLSGTQVIGIAAIPSSTPEPSSLALLSAGIAILGSRKLRKAAAKSLIAGAIFVPSARYARGWLINRLIWV